MKVAYIPFNNQDFFTDHAVQRKTICNVLDLMQPHHLDKGETGVVLLYVAKQGNLIPSDFRARYPWIESFIVVLDKDFSQVHGDNLAFRLAENKSENVVCFRVFPKPAADEYDMKREREKEMQKWGWAYYVDVEGSIIGERAEHAS